MASASAAAIAGVIETLANQDTFVPTHIGEYAGEVIGMPLLEFGRKALLAGQCLMIVGGYIVRGVLLATGRARAIRRQDGAFERIEPSQISAVPAQVSLSQRLSAPLLPICDETAAASAIYFAIQNTPSQESERQSNVLLPEFEKESLAVNCANDGNEKLTVEKSELPFHDRVQIFEPQSAAHKLQQFDQDTAAAKLASIQMGKDLAGYNNHNSQSTTTIQLLLDRISELQRQLQQHVQTTIAPAQSTPMQVKIFTPSMDSNNKLQIVDEVQGHDDPLQGHNDPYMAALGYDNLHDKVHSWAMEVINTGKWPKAQMIGNCITDVSSIVQAEVDRINKDKENEPCTKQGYKDVLDVVRTQTNTAQRDASMQASPISMSSWGSNRIVRDNVNDAIIAQIGLGASGGDDGDGNGSGTNGDIGNCNGRESKIGGYRKYEVT